MSSPARRSPPKPATTTAEGAGDALVPHLPLLRKLVRSLARRKGLREDEAEDFQSWLFLKLIERSSVLEGYQGRSKWSTYLATAVANLHKDYRNARWGKWRPSAEAKRRGPTAVRLEELVTRDGMTVDHAVELLQRNHGVRESAHDLELLAARLPQRVPRSFEGEEALDRIPSLECTEARVERSEAAEAARRVGDLLKAALAALPVEDQLILRMRWLDNLTVPTIAKALGREPKPLYRRCDELLQQLREDLERRGLTREQVAELFSREGIELGLDGPSGQSPPTGPSEEGEER